MENFYRTTTSTSKFVVIHSWEQIDESQAAAAERSGDEEAASSSAASVDPSSTRELAELEVFEKIVEGIRPFLLKDLAVIFVVGGPGCGKGDWD